MSHVFDPSVRPDLGFPLDPEHPLNYGLVRFYDFQVGGGTLVPTIDPYGIACAGRLNLTTGTWTTADERPGGTAWVLNGTSDYATENTQQGFTDISGGLSICMWFKPASISTPQCLISRWDQAANNQIWQLVLSPGGADPNGTVRWYQNTQLGGLGNIDEVATSNQCAAGSWSQIVLSSNAPQATNQQIQLNGVLVSGGGVVYSQPASSVPNLLVGARFNSGVQSLFFNGTIAYLAIWKYPLSLQQMQDLWWGPFHNFYPEPARPSVQSSAPPCPPLVPRLTRDDMMSDRGVKFSQIVNTIFNSLLTQCQIIATGVDKYSISLTGTGFTGIGSLSFVMPAEFTVTGSPLTTSGTISVNKNEQAANVVYAGPSSGANQQPTFRALVAADMPGGSASITINAPAFQTGWGTVALGGTLSPSWSNQSANLVLAGPSSGPAAAPTFRALVSADLPGGSIANSVSNSDGTLTISPTTGAVVASLATAYRADAWTSGAYS